MKRTFITCLLFLCIRFAFSQANFSSLTLYNGNLTGAKQTPLALGNWSAAAGTTNFVPDFYFNCSDNGTGTLEIHATRWGHNFLLTRDDPNGTTNAFDVYSVPTTGTNVSVYNGQNQVGVFFTTAGDSYFNGGNLAIGTTSAAGYQLAVNGTAIFNKAVVKQFPWSDYVFDRHYHLQPLESVDRFIEAHHHLPDIPSADSVAAKGIDLGNNEALLLKKIEELTLYAIRQQKTIAKESKRLDRQDKEIQELKKLLRAR